MSNHSENEKKPIYKKWWFWLIIVIVIFAITGGNSNNNSTTDSSKTTLTSGDTESTTSTTNETEQISKTDYNVGEIFENSNIAIKFVSVDEDFKGYSQYADIKDGYKVLKADFEFENVGSTDNYVSSYDFNCYADGYDCESFWSVDNSSFSSQLSSGKKSTGSVYFQIPIDSAKVQLEYTLNSWTSEKVIFIVK